MPVRAWTTDPKIGVRDLGIVVPSGVVSVAPSFDPTSIGGLVAWYDFSDISSLFTDTGRTTPVTADNDVIKGVTDKSAQAHHLSEATNPPTYKQGIQNSKSVARFDGTNDTIGASYSATAASTAFLVIRKRSAPGGSAVTSYAVKANAALFTSSGTSATDWLWFANQAAATVTLTGATAASWGIVELKVISAASLTPYYSGTALSNFDPNDDVTNATTLRFGSNFDGTAQWSDVDIGEYLQYSSALSDANRDSVESYLGTKWGITVV